MALQLQPVSCWQYSDKLYSCVSVLCMISYETEKKHSKFPDIFSKAVGEFFYSWENDRKDSFFLIFLKLRKKRLTFPKKCGILFACKINFFVQTPLEEKYVSRSTAKITGTAWLQRERSRCSTASSLYDL